MKVKINHFNLIEIVLTVAVIAFGVVVILGMLPKGLRAARNAGMESFAADVIDQMCNYLTYSKSVSKELEKITTFPDLSEYDNIKYVQLLSGDSGDFKQVNVYGLAASTAKKGLYAIVRGETVNNGGDNEAVVDFSGLLYVWRSPAKYSCVAEKQHKGDDAHKKMHDCGKEGCTFERKTVDESDRTVQVNMELSYPLSLPYAERTKRYYSFEVEK